MKRSVAVSLAAVALWLAVFSPPALAVPAAPKGVAALTTSTSSVRVTWGKVTGATSYQVWRSSTASPTYRKLAAVSSLSYVNKALAANSRYNYKVRALKGKTAGSFSSVKSAFTALPSGVMATPAGTSAIYVNWDVLPGVTSYQVWRRTGTGAFTKITTVSGDSCDNGGLKAATRYGYKVRAVLGSALSGYSTIASASTAASSTQLPAPGGFGVAAYNYQSVNVSWDAVQNAATYRIYFAKSPLATISGYDHLEYAGAGCRVIGLDAGTTYYFRVAAVDAGGTAGVPTGYLPATTSASPGAPPPPKFYLNGIDSVGSYYRMNFYRSTSPIYPAALDPTFGFFIGSSSSSMTLDSTADLSQYFYYDVAPGASLWYGFTANYGPYASSMQKLQIAALGQPTTVTADGLNYGGSVHMTWSSVPYAAKYKIYWGVGGPYPGQSWYDFKQSQLGTHLFLWAAVTGTSANVTGVTPALTRYMFVVPADSSGVEGWYCKYAITGVSS